METILVVAGHDKRHQLVLLVLQPAGQAQVQVEARVVLVQA